MGRQLFQEETIFRESIEECDRMFQDLRGWSVLTSCGLFDSGGIEDTSLFGSTEEALENVEVIQPAILFIQIGVYNLWRHWGVQPHVVVGHSLGEVAAAYASGGLSLQEAIAVIYHRSNQQAKLTGTGRMVAMRANVAQTKSICQEYNNVHIAAINGPGAITLAGDGDEIAAIVADNPGKARQLRVSSAFHTSKMDPMKTPFLQALDGILTCDSDRTVPFYSSVTGHYYQEAFDAQYWWNNVRNPVLFQPAIEDILQDTDIDIFLEVSSAATLLSCVKQIVRSYDPHGSATTVNSSLRGKNDLHSMQRALSCLYVAGVDINWENVTKSSAQWAPVPTYPWQHQSFWLETEDRQKSRLGLDDRSFKGQKGKITLSNFPFLADHVVDGRILFPGAGYVEYIVQMRFEDTSCPELRKVNFLRVLPWPEESDSKRGILNLEYIKEGQNVQVKCCQNLHCNASTDTIVEQEQSESSLPLTEIFKRCGSEVAKQDLYTRMQRVGFNYGPVFQVIDRCYMGDGESLAYLSAITDSSQRVSIAHLDATFQLALLSVGPCTSMYLPVHIESIRMTGPSLPIGQTLLVYTSIVDCDSKSLTADITLATESGVILLTVNGYRAQNFHGNRSNVDIEECIYTTHWQPLSSCTPPPVMIKEVYDESHLLFVGRTDKDSCREVNNKINNKVTVNADQTKLMIVSEISNQFEDGIKTAYRGIVNIRPFSDANFFERDICDNKSAQMEVIYIYSNADVKLHALLKLLQAVEQYPEGVRRVWVLTKSATENLTEDTKSLPIGLARAVANHIPNVSIHCVDFDPGCSLKDNVGEMMRLLEEPDVAEGELMIRKGTRYSPRIMHQELKTSSMVSENWRVEQPASTSNGISSSIDNLEFHDINTFDLPPGSVNIRVRATPLNFKDIMMAMGLLEGLESEENPSFGIECAGVVKSVGAGVHNVKVGDEVIAFGKKCFSSHVVCDARLTTLKPLRLGWTESATVGVVFVTAYLALVERANLQPSETVLIHSACGGVGLAAVQIARMIGGNVICTAGTEEKRKYLRDVLGVELVSDSRSTLFYDDVISYTDGKGVDVVLNSLSGNLLATSMLVLAPGGRFCEIGKRDILQNSSLSMNALLENKTFISCQVDILMKQRPELVQRLMKRVVHLIETSILHPVPMEAYPIHQVKEAFRFMSKGSHIGKIVFDIREDNTPAKVKPALQQFSSRCTYIITGGYGGIGQALARWLCDNSAKNIVLVSRNGAKSAASQRMVIYLRKKQVTVHQFQVDITEHRCVKSMLEDLRDNKEVPPIEGVFHLAGVIEEENLSEITHEQVHRILGAKAVGAYNLHTLTKEDDLKVFFLLSSIMAVWGHPAQPIYCAANNYLDTLAEQRHSEGLPALSVQLAPVRGAGYLEDKEDTVKVLAMKGNFQLHVDEFLRILGHLLHQRDLPVVCLANQDWALTQQFCHKSMLKFHHLASVKGQATDTADKTRSKDDVEQGIKSKMADLLCMATDTIDINQPMINYGVDSLVAIEMVNWATNKLGVTISQLDILGGMTTAGLLQKCLGE